MIKKRRKIIVVDDIMFHLLSMKERLKEHYEVFPAQNTETLFELLSKVDPELVILDINMPDHDGFAIIEMIKSDTRYDYVPVIFLTAQRDRRSLLKAMSLGAADYLVKPVSDTGLIESIEYQINPGGPGTMKPVILAVDDNPSILKAINSLLHDRYLVSTLPQPEKIRDLLAMITPDLFILDCNMPILNGFELVPIIRSHSFHSETPIIFLTSEGTLDNLSVAMQLGASDFLVKPIDEFILRDKTAQHLKDFIIRRRLNRLSQL